MTSTVLSNPPPTTDDRVKVAYIVYGFQMGGLERCVAHFVNHLDRNRFQPLIVCLGENGSAQEWITTSDVEIVALQKREGNDLRVVKRLAEVLRSRSVDVVHSHNWGTLVETVLARRWAKVPGHLHAEHGQELDAMKIRGMKKRLRGIVRRWALSQADTVVVCADSVRDRVAEQCGFPHNRMQFIPNGVDRPRSVAASSQRAVIRQQLGIQPSDIVIGSLSRLVPVKNFPTAIESISLAVRQDQRLHLILVGEGPETENLRICASSAGVAKHVHFVGRQDNVADWLETMDIYLNSSISEAMNMAILEAMSAGVPVIATDVGDNAALLNADDSCGLIVPAANAKRMSKAILQLSGDEEMRTSISRQASARYDALFTRDRMVKAYSDAYQEIIPQPCGDAVK